MSERGGTIISRSIRQDLLAVNSEQPLALPRDNIARAYLGRGDSDQDAERARTRLHWLGSQVAGQRVLDVGCGEGMLPIILGREGFDVVGVDVNADAIAFANDLLARESADVQQRVRFCEANITTLAPPSERYDTLILGEILADILNAEAFLSACLAQLRPAGRLVLTTPFGLLPHRDRKQTFFLSDLLALLVPRWRLSHLSVADGFIRCVAVAPDVDSSDNSPPADEDAALHGLHADWLRTALLQTEKATHAFQQGHWRNIDRVQTRAAELSETLKSTELQHAEQREEARRANAELRRVSQQLERARRARAELTEDNRSLRHELDRLTDDHARLARKLEAAQRELRHFGVLRARQLAELASLRASDAHHATRLYEQRLAADEKREEVQELALAPTGRRVRLDDDPKWVSEAVSGNLTYELRGTLRGPAISAPKPALVRILFLDEHGAPLTPPYPGTANGRLTGPYTYLRPDSTTGRFGWRFRAPAGARQVWFGLQAWPPAQPSAQSRPADEPLDGPALEVDGALFLKTLPTQRAERKLEITYEPTEAESALDESIDQAIRLEREPLVTESDIEGGHSYEVCGRLLRDARDDHRAALLLIDFLDRAGQRVAPPEGFPTFPQRENEGYLYIRRLGESVRFVLPLPTPDNAVRVRIGARRWRARGPVFLAPRLVLRPRVAVPKTRSAEARVRERATATRAPRRALRAAAIMDEFTHECFRDECRLVRFRADDWKAAFEAEKPDLLFVESAWQGNGGYWHLRPSQLPKLREVVEWCRAHDVPSVFWNKEDPPNFERFIHAAALFDHVFTTDAGSVARYRTRLGHDRIQALPFAAQPAIHNPIDSCRPRRGPLCFAGTYYREKYPERKREIDLLLDAARTRGLTIFDRRHGTNAPEAYRFPDALQPLVQGGLTYEEMLRAYKDYDIFLNVNSVRDSETMFARRVFELLACGTAVISTPSVGMEQLLGREAVAIVETEAQAAEWMDRLINDAHARSRMVLRGQRRIFSEHTYRHRLDTILRTIGREPSRPPQRVAVLTVTNRPDMLENAIANYQRQAYADKEWLLVLNSDDFSLREVRERLAAIPASRVWQRPAKWTLGACLNFAADQCACEYIAKFDDDDFYGEHYLTDQVHAFLYCNTPLVGKRGYYAFVERASRLALRFPEWEHRYSRFVAGATLVVRRGLLDEIRFPEHVERGVDTRFQEACLERGITPYSTDRFNFVARRSVRGLHTWAISDAEFLSKCIELPDVKDPFAYVSL